MESRNHGIIESWYHGVKKSKDSRNFKQAHVKQTLSRTKGG